MNFGHNNRRTGLFVRFLDCLLGKDKVVRPCDLADQAVVRHPGSLLGHLDSFLGRSTHFLGSLVSLLGNLILSVKACSALCSDQLDDSATPSLFGSLLGITPSSRSNLLGKLTLPIKEFSSATFLGSIISPIKASSAPLLGSFLGSTILPINFARHLFDYLLVRHQRSGTSSPGSLPSTTRTNVCFPRQHPAMIKLSRATPRLRPTLHEQT